jgi:hypothetical protein
MLLPLLLHLLLISLAQSPEELLFLIVQSVPHYLFQLKEASASSSFLEQLLSSFSIIITIINDKFCTLYFPEPKKAV